MTDTPNPLVTQIAELKAKIEAQSHQQRRLQGYIAKYATFRRQVVAAIQTTGAPRAAILEALDTLGEPTAIVRPDQAAIGAVPALEGKHAIVLYFGNDKDRDEFGNLMIEEAKRLGWQELRTEKL